MNRAARIRDATVLAGELRNIYKSLDDLSRRLASTILHGRVKEIDGDYVRLELDGGTGGRPFLSPKVLVQEMAGGTGSKFPVAIGDPMRLLSANGELGPLSLAIRDGYTDDHPNPGNGNEELIVAHGGASFRVVDGAVRIEAEKIVLAGEVHLGGDGGELVHRKGDVDSDGDLAVGSASKVFAI